MLLLAALAALVAAEAGNDCYIETRRYLGPDGGPIVPGLHVVCVSTDEVGAHAEVYMDSSSTAVARTASISAPTMWRAPCGGRSAH